MVSLVKLPYGISVKEDYYSEGGFEDVSYYRENVYSSGYMETVECDSNYDPIDDSWGAYPACCVRDGDDLYLIDWVGYHTVYDYFTLSPKSYFDGVETFDSIEIIN